MEQRTYTAAQIYDSMIRQGFDEESARIMSMAVGDRRITRDQLRTGYQKLGISGARAPEGDDGKQDSNLLSNLAEGSGAYAGYAAGQKYFKPRPQQVGLMAPAAKFGRGAMRNLVMPGAVGAAAGLGANLLSGTNYYDTATQEQLLADIGGSIAGGIAGEKLGDKYGARAADAIKAKGRKYTVEKNLAKNISSEAAKSLNKQGLKSLGGRLVGRAAAGAVGKGLGSVLGMAGGPVGSIVLGTALGYLLPKLMPGAPKSVEEEDKKRRSMWSDYEDPF